MVKLESKSSDELASWMPDMKEHYIAERVKAGESAEVARTLSDSQFAELFPNGSPAEGQHVMNVLEDEENVGTLWMGSPFSGDGVTLFIFVIDIVKLFRVRGLGRAAM